MTNEDLYILTHPLFAKHPMSKPECIRHYRTANGGKYMGLSNAAAELVITGHLVKWLANKTECAISHEGFSWVLVTGRDTKWQGPTLLHVLVAAAHTFQ